MRLRTVLIAGVLLAGTACSGDGGNRSENADTTTNTTVNAGVSSSTTKPVSPGTDETSPAAGADAVDGSAYRFDEDDLQVLSLSIDELGRGWVQDAATNDSEDEAEDDEFDGCLRSELPEYEEDPDAYDGRSVNSPEFTSADGMVSISRNVVHFRDEALAQTVYALFAENDTMQSCMLEIFTRDLVASAGEDGLTVLDPAVEIVDGVVPSGYGTALLFSFTVTDGLMELYGELAIVMVGKGDVLTFTLLGGFGDYDASFIVPIVDTTSSRLETLVGATATPITG